MKVKLLKKAKSKLRLFERNGLYYVDLGCWMDKTGMSKKDAIDYYRYHVIANAKYIFGFRPKKQIR